MIKDSPEKVMTNCWKDAYEQDLKNEIERFKIGNTAHQASPLGELK